MDLEFLFLFKTTTTPAATTATTTTCNLGFRRNLRGFGLPDLLPALKRSSDEAKLRVLGLDGHLRLQALEDFLGLGLIIWFLNRVYNDFLFS